MTISITPSVGKELGTDLKAYAGDQVPFGVTATLNSKPVDDSKVTWTVTGDKTADTSISNGQLTIGAGQASGSVLTVTAKYKNKTDSVQLTVTDAVLGYSDIHSVVPGATTKLTIDEYQWYVLVKDDVDGKGQMEALIWETDGAIKFSGLGYSGSAHGYGSWDLCDSQLTLFPNFLRTLNTLSAHSVPVTLHSRNEIQGWDTSVDECFPLTEADAFGTMISVPTTDSRNYTYSTEGEGKVLVFYSDMNKCSNGPYYPRNWGSVVSSEGVLGEPYGAYFRPAMWVTFS